MSVMLRGRVGSFLDLGFGVHGPNSAYDEFFPMNL